MTDAYAEAGVDISEATRAVDLMKAAVKSTHDTRVIAGVGAFGGIFDVSSLRNMNAPVLVASTDGVGTKTKIAAQFNRWDGIGADIVNHGINDILCQGARPLFFMDYIAASKLEAEVVAAIVSSMAGACRAANCVILGGETAEMPGVYHSGELDVAGTIVGVLEKDKIIDGAKVQVGDALLVFPSNGLHTNGFSLARKTLEHLDWAEARADLNGVSISDALLEPHTSYLEPVTQLQNAGIEIRALAHITGGGLWDNVPRVLPENLSAIFSRGSWPVPAIFNLILEQGQISERDAFHALNMGAGMVAVIPQDQLMQALEVLPGHVFAAGEIRVRAGDAVVLE
jgi:phosphoribosylformylglycinamidine cyclo-ligase